jgi:hypothetical protein
VFSILCGLVVPLKGWRINTAAAAAPAVLIPKVGGFLGNEVDYSY